MQSTPTGYSMFRGLERGSLFELGSLVEDLRKLVPWSSSSAFGSSKLLDVNVEISVTRFSD